MAKSGFESNGTDLDDIFDAYDGGTKPSATGFVAGSQDLRDRYSPIAEGEQISHDTGFAVGSTDLRKIFAGKGTTNRVIADPGYGVFAAQTVATGSPGTITASVRLDLLSDGTWANQRTVQSMPGTKITGDWSKAPSSGFGDDYDVAFSWSTDRNDGGTVQFTSGWQRLSATRTFFASISGPGNAAASAVMDGSLRIRIRRRSSGKVLSDVTRAVTVSIQRL